MEFTEVVNRRRTVRDWSDKEVDYEAIKRIVKLIDDCGTIQKAVYLANISRGLAKHEIDKMVVFKLGQCILSWRIHTGISAKR